MLISRILSAFIMLLVFLSSMFLFSGRFFSFAIYLASLLALYEWSKLLYFKSHEKKIFLVISLCFIYLIDKYLSYNDARSVLIGASIFWICIAPLFLIFKTHLKIVIKDILIMSSQTNDRVYYFFCLQESSRISDLLRARAPAAGRTDAFVLSIEKKKALP